MLNISGFGSSSADFGLICAVLASSWKTVCKSVVFETKISSMSRTICVLPQNATYWNVLGSAGR